jgi:hypothetical protein
MSDPMRTMTTRAETALAVPGRHVDRRLGRRRRRTAATQTTNDGTRS